CSQASCFPILPLVKLYDVAAARRLLLERSWLLHKIGRQWHSFPCCSLCLLLWLSPCILYLQYKLLLYHFSRFWKGNHKDLLQVKYTYMYFATYKKIANCHNFGRLQSTS
ncbi:hypothetical protein E2320_007971, partial [Naja naja]